MAGVRMATGTVKGFNAEKGFGFEQEVVPTCSCTTRTSPPGSFEITQGQKGPQSDNVVPA